MLSQLEEDYRESIVCHCRWNMYDRSMVIDMANMPTEVLCNDPHEARFLKDTESLDLKLDITSQNPNLGYGGSGSTYPANVLHYVLKLFHAT